MLVTIATVTYTDLFIPELAPLVLEVAGEYDDKVAAVVITCWAYEAECVAIRN